MYSINGVGAPPTIPLIKRRLVFSLNKASLGESLVLEYTDHGPPAKRIKSRVPLLWEVNYRQSCPFIDASFPKDMQKYEVQEDIHATLGAKHTCVSPAGTHTYP
ncbi:hypothetical protein BDZ89DRAFT_1071050 [Hymenopellis radicata]|nr:hypothetical protein BDZ89DRAFT_1071050 [Hymenopellis radicata]